jgi:hypothetical protein
MRSDFLQSFHTLFGSDHTVKFSPIDAKPGNAIIQMGRSEGATPRCLGRSRSNTTSTWVTILRILPQPPQRVATIDILYLRAEKTSNTQVVPVKPSSRKRSTIELIRWGILHVLQCTCYMHYTPLNLHTHYAGFEVVRSLGSSHSVPYSMLTTSGCQVADIPQTRMHKC